VKQVTLPAVLPAVAYPDVRLEQSGGAKLWGQSSPTTRPRGRRSLQAQCRRERGLNGMANVYESLINAVKVNE